MKQPDESHKIVSDDPISARSLLGLLRDAPAAVSILMGKEHRFVFANGPMKEIFLGRELVGKTVLEALPELADQPFPEILDEVLRTGEPFEGREFPAELDRTGDGTLELSYWNFVYQPLRNREGSIVGVVVFAFEVTEQVLARDKAKQDENRYRALASSLPQQIWSATPEGSLDFVNQQVLKYFDRTFEQMIGWGWKDVIHPSDLDECLKRWSNSLETGEDYEVEFRLRRHDGAFRWFLGRAFPIRDEAGAIHQWMGSNTDIDDRKRAEDFLRFQTVASSLFAAGRDLEKTLSDLAAHAVPRIAHWCTVDLLDAEAESYRRIAVAHADPSKVALIHELTEKFRPPAERDPILETIRTGVPKLASIVPSEMAERISRNEEHARLVDEIGIASWMILPLRSRKKPLGALTFVSGEPAAAYTEADLQRAVEFAEKVGIAIDNTLLLRDANEANRAKDQFLATLSHELRTPLTAILGWSRLLNESSDRETVNEAIETIQRNAVAQAQIIDDVLDVSRIVSGKLRLEIRDVDVEKTAREALETVRPAAEARGVHLKSEVEGEIGSIRADSNRMLQVLWNLLNNAIKFTPRGGEVTLSLRRTSDEVLVQVSDTGSGIPESQIDAIFEPFKQADSSTTRSHGGLGLGLAIVRYIVEGHGGDIEVESGGEGKGTTFTVRMPLGQPTPSERVEEIQSAPEELSAEGLPDLAGLRIVCVDDQEDSRRLMERTFTQCGAVVETAGSLSAALESIERQRPDVLVSDIAMPGGDGYELIRRVRADEQGESPLPALALTAFGRPEDRDRVLGAGFDEWAKKPIDPVRLARLVGRLAGGASSSMDEPETEA